MTRVRPPAVAGLFYPDDPRELAATVDGLLAGAGPASDAVAPPVAIVAPHAGYVYSGPVAASAYAPLAPWREHVSRVYLIGPAHRVAIRGLALSSADAFATPLGDVAVDREAVDALLAHPVATIDDRAHAPEHCLEVQLPFLQRTLGDGWTLVPMLAAGLEPGALADVMSAGWGDPGVLWVVSTDLSHDHDLATARQLDRATAAAIVDRAWERIERDDACGAVPLRGALELARRRRERVEQLDLRTSGDTAGDHRRVVGYGSFAIR